MEGILVDYRHAVRQVKEEKVKLTELRKQVEYTKAAQQILQTVAQQVQQQVHDQIAAVVTKCLEAVFDDPYQFHIRFEKKRGKTDARLVFTRNGRDIDPTSAAGGGVVDVAAFALRLASLLLVRPKRRRLLVLDEPFKMVSRDYIGRVREMLIKLSEEFNLQIIMVTHDENLAVGKTIKIG